MEKKKYKESEYKAAMKALFDNGLSGGWNSWGLWVSQGWYFDQPPSEEELNHAITVLKLGVTMPREDVVERLGYDPGPHFWRTAKP